MISSDQGRNDSDTSILGKLCTINICGLSQRSNMMLDKFSNDNNILLMGVQETGSGKQWKTLTNMKTFEDTNNQVNKGCAMMVKKDAMFTELGIQDFN